MMEMNQDGLRMTSLKDLGLGQIINP